MRPIRQNLCKNCNKPRGEHRTRAGVAECPIGKRTGVGYLHFSPDSVFEPRITKLKDTKVKEAKAVQENAKEAAFLVYHGEDFMETFAIDDLAKLPKNLLRAIEHLDGKIINEDEGISQKAISYFNAALAKQENHLFKDNPYNANRFAHALRPFAADDGKLPKLLGNVRLIVIGWF